MLYNPKNIIQDMKYKVLFALLLTLIPCTSIFAFDGASISSLCGLG